MKSPSESSSASGAAPPYCTVAIAGVGEREAALLGDGLGGSLDLVVLLRLLFLRLGWHRALRTPDPDGCRVVTGLEAGRYGTRRPVIGRLGGRRSGGSYSN